MLIHPDPSWELETERASPIALVDDQVETDVQTEVLTQPIIKQIEEIDTTPVHVVVEARANDRLEDIYRRQHRWEELAEFLLERVELTEDRPEQIATLLSVAKIYEEELGDQESAFMVLQVALQRDHEHEDVARSVERLATALGGDHAREAILAYQNVLQADPHNLTALRALERLYEETGQADQTSRIDLYCELGEVYARELQDFSRAIEAYTEALTLDPNLARALDALGGLYELNHDWDRANDMMSQLAQLSDEPAVQADLYYRIGRNTYHCLRDPERAEGHLLHALRIHEGHAAAIEELARLHADRGSWLEAAQLLVRAASNTEGALDKARLRYEAARIYLDRLECKDEAAQHLAAALALDPEHLAAAELLAELYFESGRWQELMPVLELLVRMAPQRNLEDQALRDLHDRAARCAAELRDFDAALKHNERAYEIDPTCLPVLGRRAVILVHVQDLAGAREMLEKALEIDPNHPETLKAVAAIRGEEGDWEAVIRAKRSLLADAAAEDTVRLLAEIGAICHGALGDSQRAIGVYGEALALEPEDHQLLQKLLDLYTETEQWKEAVEIIDRFAAIEEDPIRKGSYYQAAGTICREKIQARDEAVAYYDLALDSFFHDGSEKIPKTSLPRALKAFADIDKIFTQRRDWKSQERAYRKMIKRLKPGDEILADLWHALGEIYRSRLKQHEPAVAAFEIAQQLDTGNVQRRELLAELYVLGGLDQADKAVEQHMEIIKAEPFKYSSYRALRRIYMDTHQYDKVWCVCSALALLGRADHEEIQFYEQYKPREFVKAKQRMTDESWRSVIHPNESWLVNTIFRAIWRRVALIRAKAPRCFGIKRKDRRRIEADQLQFSKIFYYAGQALNVPLPDVYLQPERQGEIAVANAKERGMLSPSFVVRANLLQGRSQEEIAFASARWLTFMRPEHYLKLALPSKTELRTAFFSAIRLVKPNFPIPQNMRALVAQFLPKMQKRLQPAWLEQFSEVVDQALEKGPEVDLAEWGAAVDATAHRAGLVICGDLEVAARMVSMEPVAVGGPTTMDKLKELVHYSISEPFFKVRSQLGLALAH